MTYAELNTNFQTLYDSKASLAAPGYTDDEIDIFLNKGQEILVEELYSKKLLWFLRDITTSVQLTASVPTTSIAGMFNNVDDATNDFARVVQVSVTSLTSPDFLYHVGCTVNVYREDLPIVAVGNAETISTEYIEELEAEQFKTTIDNYPMFRIPKLFYQGNTAIIVGDKFTRISYNANDVSLTYIYKPVAIANGTSTTSSLDPQVHKDIVEKAVEYALLPVDTVRAPTVIQGNNQIGTI